MEAEAWDLPGALEHEETQGEATAEVASQGLQEADPVTSQDTQAWEPPGMEPLPEFDHGEPEPRTESGESEPQAYEPEEVDEDLASGVTPSADWGMDEDPESYSAPV